MHSSRMAVSGALRGLRQGPLPPSARLLVASPRARSLPCPASRSLSSCPPPLLCVSASRLGSSRRSSASSLPSRPKPASSSHSCSHQVPSATSPCAAGARSFSASPLSRLLACSPPVPCLLARSFSSSHLSRKLRLHQERAARGHVEYLRQLERPPSDAPFPLPPSPSSSSPASAASAKAAAFAEESAVHTPEPSVLVRSAEEWIRRDFFFPLSHRPDAGTAGAGAAAMEQELRNLSKQRASEEGDHGGDANALASLFLTPEDPQYGGAVEKIELPGFGEINIVHGDILAGAASKRSEGDAKEPATQEERRNEVAADALLVPVPPNFLPYRGFGLEILERGGTALQKAAFTEVKQKLQQREAARGVLASEGGDMPEKQRQLGFSPLQKNVHREDAAGGLDPGDVVLTPTFGVCPSVSLLAFVVTPYYWQGNSTEAARRLRFTMRRALADLNQQGPGSLILPFVGIGLYGYEPRGAAEILVESAVEQLLQVDAVEPNYTLRKITFVERDATNAALLAEAAQAAKRAWLPEHQVVPAPVYWSQKQRRLLDVTDGMLMFCRKHTRLSFKKHHGVIRRQKTHYFSNVRPFLWRSSRVLEPPPLMLHKHSGAVADWQLPARPFYRQGVSGMLFPPRVRRGFPVMRVNSKGQFVGVNKMPYIAEKAQPRM
ncbi:hypothetical protein BESB_083000 [Besnoitia besnoiti]|uniref:Macro domain-containing protein n=1 Tax=Besnoitia besnoiti TaxID=94643 RepID=A0A2A9M9V2_BESBE|nr:hypothetical protein BESB_083000 [Besnoitia besnoiti]PFH33101.1 hypothetical protein BESB_083000 [Besnoitia besnoiti]